MVSNNKSVPVVSGTLSTINLKITHHSSLNLNDTLNFVL